MANGRRANMHGRQLEGIVAEELDHAGYEHVWPTHLILAMREMDQPVYAWQVQIGRDIYGKRRRLDFLLFHPQKHPDGLVIQCKSQSSAGSVEEKYPFEVLSIDMGEYDAIIVLDGGGYSQGAEAWLRRRAGQGRLRNVFDRGEFQRFARDDL